MTPEELEAIRARTLNEDSDALLAEVDRLRAIVNEDFGPTAADEPGMCECGMDMDAHAGGFALLHHDEIVIAAERARIGAAVVGLPAAKYAGGFVLVVLADVLAIIAGGEK